jgi:hypothetical protein
MLAIDSYSSDSKNYNITAEDLSIALRSVVSAKGKLRAGRRFKVALGAKPKCAF